MLVKHLFFSLLPVLVFSAISIRIKVDKGNDAVELKGTEVNAISEAERKTFQIDEVNLRKLTGKYYDKPCDEVYVRPPTVRGDVYSKNNWDVVERYLTPRKARILGVDAKPVAVNTVEYVNYSSHNATYNTMVTQTVEESVSSTKSKGGELTVAQEINYSVNFGVGSVGGATSLSYSANWNEETTKTRTVTVGTTSGVTVTIPPGGKVDAVLTATQGTMKIEVDYVAEVEGTIYCYNRDPSRGNFGIDVNRLLYKLKLPQYVYYTEKLEIGFYANVRVEVRDSKDHKMAEQQGSILSEGQQRRG